MSTDEAERSQSSYPPETVSIEEWSSSPPLSLSEADVTFIEQRINESKERLSTSHTGDGHTILQSSRFAGIVALPDGPTLEIIPKSAGENFIRLFRYATGLNSHTIGKKTDVKHGSQFLDALAALYIDELSTILQRGIVSEYRRTEASEEYVKGHIDIQRQLQRQGLVGTQFECTYDDLTADTTVNQAILYAAVILKRLVSDTALQRTLERYEIRFRRTVSFRQISAQQFTDIEITRLNEHYRDALRLAELIIRNVYVENLRQGERGSFGLLINMDEIFESVVERAVRAAVSQIADWRKWRVEGQANVTGLLTGGSPRVNMRPDFVVRDETDSVVLTGDAKWKTNNVQRSDIYQLTAYQLNDDVPGALIYPQQDGELETEYTVQGAYPMAIHELPTAATISNFEALRAELEQSAESLLRRLLAQM